VVIKSHEKGVIYIDVANGAQGKYNYLECTSSQLSCTFDAYGDIEVAVNALQFQPGTYTESVKVGFSEDIYSEISFKFTILENHAPVTSGEIGYVILEGTSARHVVDLKDYFRDPDQESLSYSASADKAGLVKMNMSGTQLYIDSQNYGETTISVRAKDTRGAYAQQDFKLLVYDTSLPLSVGPDPVEDFLYISKGGKHTMDVKLFSPAGALLYSGSITGDYFSPATLDMSACAPGRYALRVTFGDTVYNTMVIKQ
jgi:hypothetical protein